MIYPRIETINSWVPWPTTTIIWGIHGNEPTWFELIQMLKDSLCIDAGVVTLISAHHEAKEKNARFIDKDLNRSFGKSVDETIESRLAQLISPYITKANYVLDVHNTVKNSSPRFCISEHEEFAQFIGIPFYVWWCWEKFMWSTDQFADREWAKWFCLEAWWIHESKDHTQFAYDSSINLLKSFGNIEWDPNNYWSSKKLVMDIMYHATWNYESKREFADFDPVKAGEMIWVDEDRPIMATEDWFILFSSMEARRGELGFMFLKERGNSK